MLWDERCHLKAQGVHLEQHLDGEEDDEEHVCDLLEVLEPLWLVVVLGGEDAGVEQHQDDDEPEHRLRLDSAPTVPPRLAVPPAAKHDFSENILLELSTGLRETSQRLEKAPSTAFSLLKLGCLYKNGNLRAALWGSIASSTFRLSHVMWE